MVRVLLVFALLTSCPSIAHDSNYGWLPSKQKLISLLLLGLIDIANSTNSSGETSSYNCTDPYYLSDQDITTMTWFQIYSGIFAVVLISSNFVSAYWFYEKSQKDLSRLLREQVAEAKQENKNLHQDKKTTNRILKRLREKIGDGDEFN